MVEGRLVFDITPTGNAGDRHPAGRLGPWRNRPGRPPFSASHRGKSGIMVTHDTRMVDLTDRTLSILDGVVTEAAAAARIEQPRHPYTSRGRKLS